MIHPSAADLHAARCAVRRSARILCLRGSARWRASAFILVNVAAALGLPDADIRREWASATRRAEHLRALLAQ